MTPPNLFTIVRSLSMLAAIATMHAMESMPPVHPLFADHVVLQRDARVPVWGWGEPGSAVSVRFSDQRKDAVVAGDGRWQVELEPMTASAEGRTLEVRTAAASRAIRDVLVGDVWICSGQSNMEMGIGVCEEAEEIARAEFPRMRLLTVPRRISFSPEATIDVRWLPCGAETLGKGVWGGFSAAAYFFGRDLHRELGVPIGLIHASWGGSPCEAWTSGDALAGLGFYESELARVSEVASLPGSNKLDDFMDRWYREKDPGTGGEWHDPQTDVSTWQTATMPATWSDAGLPGHEGIVWLRRTFDVPDSWEGEDLMLDLGAIADVDTTWINGSIVGRCDSYEVSRSYAVRAGVVRPGRNVLAMRVMNQGGGGFTAAPDGFLIRPKDGTKAPVSLAGPWQLRASATRAQTGAALAGNPGTPSVLYHGMIAPLVPYAIKGAIWYQGEANTREAARYHALLPALIRDWRARFGTGDFPFHIVSLANYQPPASSGDANGWPALREAQARTAKQVPNCGLAVTIDIGDAADIHPKNKREVGRRLAMCALAKTYGRDVEWSGPWYRSMAITGDRVRLAFDHAGGGLVAKGGVLSGFAIAGEDRRFVPASATIDGETVVVSSSSVSRPAAVRYGWSANPWCNLLNKTGLPAVPFRTDDWPLREP